MDTVETALASLQQAATDGRLDAWCRDHDVTVVTVFGSAAFDAATANDLDLGVVAGDGFDPVTAAVAVRDVVGAVDVDLVDVAAAEPVLASRALLGLPLWERRAGAYVRRRDAALLREMDTRWLRDLDLELALPT